MTLDKQNTLRRTLLKSAWAVPIISTVSLPSHAQTSVVTPSPTAQPTTSIQTTANTTTLTTTANPKITQSCAFCVNDFQSPTLTNSGSITVNLTGTLNVLPVSSGDIEVTMTTEVTASSGPAIPDDVQVLMYTPDGGGNADITGANITRTLPPIASGAYPMVVKLSSKASYNGLEITDIYEGTLTSDGTTVMANIDMCV